MPERYFYMVYATHAESKKDWMESTIELKDVDYFRHPTKLEELLSIDGDSYDIFNFQRSMNIEAINKETKAIDRKAHMFWEISCYRFTNRHFYGIYFN